MSKVADVQSPLLTESPLPLHYPPFDEVDDDTLAETFEAAMAMHLAEVQAVAEQAEAPTFENTLVALQKSGQALTRVASVFFGRVAADTNPTLEAVRSEMAPKLAAHQDAVLLNPKLFARVQTIYEGREGLGLDPESLRLVEITHRDFVRAGAQLSGDKRARLEAINGELARLTTQFSQNVLAEVNDLAVVVDTEAELEGLGEGAIAAAAKEAERREMPGKYVIALLNTSGQPPLASLENRALRQRIHETSLSRGSRGGEFDNREVLVKTVKLRAERAQLLGYPNHAAFALETQTARTVDAVNERLALLAPAAAANAKKEEADLAKMAQKDGITDFAGWDWAYYSEKLRAERYAFDASKLEPYLELNRVLTDGVFFAAGQLYGITFEERSDLPVYHPDVRVFDVFEADGSQLAIFIFDPYARASKRGGAWMNAYVTQSGLLETHPVVANHLNITKPTEGEPALLTWDEVTTLFHEFGHALHGMFSDVKYPEFAGTAVPRDFVEYPSQVNEMWAIWPEVLASYAKHHDTGEPMPKALLDKVLATQTYGEGFATTEYLAASILDQAWHQLTPEEVPTADGVAAFEAKVLKDSGLGIDAVPPRYRSTYFSHIMGGYSAGYYAYIWSEVLDADTVAWFKENGGLKRENGDHFRKTLLSQGGSEEAMKLYLEFRGQPPAIEHLLKRRALEITSAD